ncbi:MAG TPA: hypothetical protein VFT22_23145, partial [Kofleriaceae bacterium]|nr:hypothetical protein [Kofleriaceae bacterium]
MKALLVASLMLFACGGKSKDMPPPAAPSTPPAEATPPPAPEPSPPTAATPTPPPAPAAPAIPPYEPAADVPEPIRAAIAAPDRSEKDRALDAGRKPGEVLAFFGIAPGQKVGELFAGPGYTTEIIARVVGDGGKVYAQNSKEILDKFARGPLTD